MKFLNIKLIVASFIKKILLYICYTDYILFFNYNKNASLNMIEYYYYLVNIIKEILFYSVFSNFMCCLLLKRMSIYHKAPASTVRKTSALASLTGKLGKLQFNYCVMNEWSLLYFLHITFNSKLKKYLLYCNDSKVKQAYIITLFDQFGF
jgi:hypothetical protein